ncbi:O-antigen ligase family protein [Sphingomonas faeni]|uniref:O-antigen ligase family protein n=1 Tax=Sphingomonas faeni TaxID=185950 RepID=UPI00335E8290
MYGSERTGGSRHRKRSTARHGKRPSLLKGNGDFFTAAAYLILITLFGGGLATWNIGYALVSLATIVLVLLLAWRDGFAVLGTLSPIARIALVGIAILPLLQMIPLPPSIWQALPGQALRIETLGLAGRADTWQPLSMEPVSTALCAILATGFVAFMGFLLRLNDAQFRRMLHIALGLTLLGVVLGVSQVVSDGTFPKFHPANTGATMLGFYANKNHMALAIACSIVLFGFVVSRQMFARDQRRLVNIGYIVFAMVCIVTTNSRAGLALGVLAAAAVFADLARGVALKWKLAAVAGAVLFVVAILSTSAFELVSGRIEDVDGDLRWQIASWSWPLAQRYGLLGSGVGSFTTLFAANEQLAWVKPTFVNSAHNEYLQLVIEFGVPGVLLLAALVVSLPGPVRAFRGLSRKDPRRIEMLFGFAVVALFAFHSAVDYPLRRPAAWGLFALALAAIYRGAAVARAPIPTIRDDAS